MPFFDRKLAVVLPAGGSGERVGLRPEKQFQTILGRPLISFTLETFLSIRAVDIVVIVVQKQSEELMIAILAQYHNSNSDTIKIAFASETRHGSIRNSIPVLKAAGFNPEDIIIVQDAVRPFVSESIFLEVTRKTAKNGACGLRLGLVSTVLRINSDDSLASCLDRKLHVRSEMPQGFQFRIFDEMYAKITKEQLENGTECLDLAIENSSIVPSLVIGDPEESWKITYSRDLTAAAIVIKRRNFQNLLLVDPDNKLAAFDEQQVLFRNRKKLENIHKADLHSYLTIILSQANESQNLAKILKETSQWLGLAIVFIVSEQFCTKALTKLAKHSGSCVASIITNDSVNRIEDHVKEIVERRSLLLSGLYLE